MRAHEGPPHPELTPPMWHIQESFLCAQTTCCAVLCYTLPPSLTDDDPVVSQLLWCLLLQVPQQALGGLLDCYGVHAVEPWAHLLPQASSACG